MVATRNGIQGNRTSAPLSENTLLQYEKHFNGMSFFFSLIGDYESLIPLQHMELEYCPSMNHESIIVFFKWRTGANGSILTDKNGDPMKDISNDLIKCVGSWLAPTNVEQCRSAVFSLHRSREQKGPF